MGITFYEKERIFKLDTPKTSYLIGIAGELKFVGHIYYGRKLSGIEGVWDKLRIGENDPSLWDENSRDRISLLSCFPMEYSSHGVGDYRESSVRVRDKHGNNAVLFTYDHYEIIKGKPALEGLPATFGRKGGKDGEADVTTLIITCVDKVLNLKAELYYSVFEDTDAIARSVRIINEDSEAIYLEKVMSCCLDMENKDFDVLTMHGSWARERRLERKKLGHGKYSIGSVRGGNCHQEHPFMALLSEGTNQTMGEVYGFNFIYSGNFLIQAEIDQFNNVRVVAGIHPEDFCWKLMPGEAFQAPEIIMTYSPEGLDGMTHSFHTLYREHLIRSPYNKRMRPILINNWEATYFDFDEKKLLDIARESVKLGIEMLVIDDGWFGNRYDDNRALGDWYVNEKKLKGGLKYISDEVKKLGMKLGIWFEPEMISPDSDLYRAHPDWAIAIPGRVPGRSRNQYVLDISRKEVRDYIMDKVCAILHSTDISYVKWDMNRPLSDLGSAALPSDRQGELYHRYVLGVYEMQQRLLDEFPDLLLENCSGGGGRFDPGMLYFSPQIWCSDDTDAIERLAIQESTAMIYPLSSIGAHVSVCPNHTVGRVTPFDTRAIVALAGTFGYELDITKLSDEEKRQVRIQTAYYHKLNDLVREGVYYRLASYQCNNFYDSFQICSPDGLKSLVFYVQVKSEPNQQSRFIKLKGLKEDALYRIKELDLTKETESDDVAEGKILNGSVMMNAGICIERMWGDFRAKLLYIEQLL